jgi:mxaJ protein
MTVIPDNNNRADCEKVGFQYSTSIGVRKGETALLAELNKIIKNKQSEIGELLAAEGIPLLNESGATLSLNQ